MKSPALLVVDFAGQPITQIFIKDRRLKFQLPGGTTTIDFRRRTLAMSGKL
jgi:hypothetical protein